MARTTNRLSNLNTDMSALAVITLEHRNLPAVVGYSGSS
jgi:hypothetical protein